MIFGAPLTPYEDATVAYLADAGVWADVELSDAHVASIREKLGEHAILCMCNRGYTLGAPGVTYHRTRAAA